MARARTVLLPRVGGVIAMMAMIWVCTVNPALAGDEQGRFPSFSLTNFDGERVSLDSLGGRASIIVFTYAKCKYSCPMITFYLKDLDQELGNPEGLRFVHISVNPADDSAHEIQTHFKKFGIDPAKDPRWFFLNGPEDDIQSLLDEAGIDVKRIPVNGDILIEHTIRVQVIDRSNRVIASFPTYLWDEERMKNAIREALASE